MIGDVRAVRGGEVQERLRKVNQNNSNIDRISTFRFSLIYILLSLCLLTLLVTTSLGGAPIASPTIPMASPTVTQTENLTNLTNQNKNWQNLSDYYKNETLYYQNLYENDSINVSNKNIFEIKNNIDVINQNIMQINQDIKNIENKTELNFYIGIIIEVTLLSFLGLSIYFKKIENYIIKNRKSK